MKPLSRRFQDRIGRRIAALPRPLIEKLLRRQLPSYRGAKLDARIFLMLRMMEIAKRPNFEDLPVEKARALMRQLTPVMDVRPREMFSVEDYALKDKAQRIPIRVYRPEPTRKTALVYYHGGGFTIGDLETHDPTCRYLAHQSGHPVVSVDYRLAPEHPHPAPFEDAIAAFRILAERGEQYGIDPRRLAVGGDSAGGNLSALVALACRDNPNGPQPVLQALIYPATDLLHDTTSYRDLGGDYFLTHPLMEWFGRHYRAPLEAPSASPIRATGFAGLAPAYVATAGFDPLRDEAEIYAKRLEEAGVPVKLRCFESAVHGFINMAGVLEDGRVLLDEVAAEMKTALAGRSQEQNGAPSAE